MNLRIFAGATTVSPVCKYRNAVIPKQLLFFHILRIQKLLKAQQNEKLAINFPAFIYLRRLIGVIFNKSENDKEIVFKTVFILSQINSPRILHNFSLSQLGQDDFVQEDIKIIKENVKLYIYAFIKEAEIA